MVSPQFLVEISLVRELRRRFLKISKRARYAIE
jgi:hypothetical protein